MQITIKFNDDSNALVLDCEASGTDGDSYVFGDYDEEGEIVPKYVIPPYNVKWIAVDIDVEQPQWQ